MSGSASRLKAAASTLTRTVETTQQLSEEGGKLKSEVEKFLATVRAG